MNFNFKTAIPHIIAVLLFLAISAFYLSPAFEGFSLKQDDINNHKGVAKEISDHREMFNEEPLWTNSMFGGMPATQVSVVHGGNLMNQVFKVITLWLPHPVNYMFLYFLGFYILCICLSIRPWLSLTGALMFGFSSFFYISLAAGHNSKVMAMAFMPMIVGAFIYCLRKKAIAGSILFALFLALELRSNHIQITYYTFMILLLVGIYELIISFKSKTLISFFKKCGLLIAGIALAVLCNSGNLFMTYDYLEDSQRGPSELTSIDKEENTTGGLDLSYMTNWSYGIGESVNLLIPKAKGKGSGLVLLNEEIMTNSKNANFSNFLRDAYQKGWPVSTYWGNQPSTSGPVYIGASVIFLFLIGMFFLKDKIKWPLFIVAVIALMLSWGNNFMGLTELFAAYFPGYAKFRSVTMILVILELIIPLIGVLWLFQFVEKRNASFSGDFIIFNKELPRQKVFLGVSLFFFLVLLILSIKPDSFLSFISDNEENIISQLTLSNPMYQQNIDELVSHRINVFKSSAFKSLFFSMMIFISILALNYKKISKTVFIVCISIIVTGDLWMTSKDYLNNENHSTFDRQMGMSGKKFWQDEELKKFPHSPKPADIAIRDIELRENSDLVTQMQQEINRISNEDFKREHKNRIKNISTFKLLNFNTNYRVLEFGNPLNTARTSYLHKSIGGYSAVKVKRTQEMIDRYFQSNYSVLTNALNSGNIPAMKSAHFFNMLNTKYYILDLNSSGVVGNMNPQKPDEKPGVLPNPFALGNAWSVSHVNWVKNADEEIAAVGEQNFDPTNTVVIDERFKDIIGDELTLANCAIQLIDYKPNYLKYTANADGEALVVFSEIFYDKGWKAFIDGVEIPHFRANYILRGLKISSGQHDIEFKFNLPIYQKASLISLTSSSIIVLLFLILLIFGFIDREFPTV